MRQIAQLDVEPTLWRHDDLGQLAAQHLDDAVRRGVHVVEANLDVGEIEQASAQIGLGDLRVVEDTDHLHVANVQVGVVGDVSAAETFGRGE